MINFKSRCETIRNADKIMRRAKTVYPHYSESMSNIRINEQIVKCKEENLKNRLSKFRTKMYLKIFSLRDKCGQETDLLRDIIFMLKNKNIGNCYEEAVLCGIIGRLNGIKNIYPANITFNRNRSGCRMQLDHVVAVISDNLLEKDTEYSFKNKEAIILDPWLGITEFAQEYFTKLRNNYIRYFALIPENGMKIQNIRTQAGTLQKFHQAKRELFKPDFCIKVHEKGILESSDIQMLKKEFPELIIKQ